MNPSIIIATITALLAGFAGGTYYKEQFNLQTVSNFQTAEVAAEDFVSLRPELSALPSETIIDTEKEDLLFMREEEKLARDVYQILYETWNLPFFSNIAQSEQTHTEAIRDLLEKYEIIDPVSDDRNGVFQNTELQALYKSLVEKGLQSETDALTVGVMIEELDIKDISESISRTDNADIALVYENLMRGSRNHLRAFNRQLTTRGITYDPQYISTEDYQTIVSGETERGNQQGQQAGRGHGRGGV